MNVKEMGKEFLFRSDISINRIVREYLYENGFDGLCDPNSKCCCDYECLLSCKDEHIFYQCKPGYKVKDKDGGFRIVGSLRKVDKHERNNL